LFRHRLSAPPSPPPSSFNSILLVLQLVHPHYLHLVIPSPPLRFPSSPSTRPVLFAAHSSRLPPPPYLRGTNPPLRLLLLSRFPSHSSFYFTPINLTSFSPILSTTLSLPFILGLFSPLFVTQIVALLVLSAYDAPLISHNHFSAPQRLIASWLLLKSSYFAKSLELQHLLP